MKVKNYRESIKEGSISFNASSPFLEWVYGLKAKRIIRKIRKSKRLPKATKITYEDIERRQDNLLANNVAIDNLTVVDIYTTKQGDSAGAMTLTCEDANHNEITIRTIVLKDEVGNVITQEYFKGKNISVTSGIFDKFDGEYQIRVFGLANIIINN